MLLSERSQSEKDVYCMILAQDTGKGKTMETLKRSETGEGGDEGWSTEDF